MKKLRKNAQELLQAANKVYHYRRDVMTETRLGDLERAVKEVDILVRDKSAEAAPLEAAMKRLDALLRKVGGKIYPKTFWSDNVEVLLVAAIIVIGIRTFFFQPFIIPTNSMYPTYSGMNAVIYDSADEAPNAVEKAFRLVTLGARHKQLVAQNSGELSIPMIPTSDGNMRFMVERVKGKKWFVLPAVLAEYTILVGNVPHKIRVPADFGMNDVIRSLIPENAELMRTGDFGTGYALDLHREVKAGESLLEFDITLGDALFVDRLSYHFIRPDAGDPFVFRTRDIPGIEGGRDNVVDKYYIKRIGGVGGETIEIRDGTLLVNGQPRTEAEAFERNAAQEGEYDGYLNHTPDRFVSDKGFTGLGKGDQLTIPNDKYVALGDNSDNSLDSRYWGFVPEKAVIGRAIFIYYPFTKRWGLAE